MRRVLLFCCLLAACDLPRDPDDTLKHVQNATMRVGIVNAEPWTIDVGSGSAPSGVEPSLVQAIAQELGATVEWVRKPEHELMRDLHDRKIHLVIGGFTDVLPWKQEVAFTRPYFTDRDRHVLAAPPGENAWLVAVERAIERHKGEITMPNGETARR